MATYFHLFWKHRYCFPQGIQGTDGSSVVVPVGECIGTGIVLISAYHLTHDVINYRIIAPWSSPTQRMKKPFQVYWYDTEGIRATRTPLYSLIPRSPPTLLLLAVPYTCSIASDKKQHECVHGRYTGWFPPPYIIFTSTLTSLTWRMRPGLQRFSRSSASVYYTECKPKN